MPKITERDWENKKLGEMSERIAPMMAKLRAKYPKEMNIDGFEPALTSDVAEICFQLELDTIARCAELVKSKVYIFEIEKEDYLPEVYKHLKSKNEAYEDIANAINKLKE